MEPAPEPEPELPAPEPAPEPEQQLPGGPLAPAPTSAAGSTSAADRTAQARAQPRWVPDADAERCMLCTPDLRFRAIPGWARHHCRSCGWDGIELGRHTEHESVAGWLELNMRVAG